MGGITQREMVVHAYAHLAPDAGQHVHAATAAVWERCAAVLDLGDPIGTFPVDLDLAARVRGLAARQDRRGRHQAFLRVEDQTVTLSLLVAPDREAGWADLDALVDRALGPPGTFFGLDRLYLGKCVDEPLDDDLVPVRRATPWFRFGERLSACEGDVGSDARDTRRIVVLAHPDDDRLLSRWVWVRPGPHWADHAADVPRLARYLRSVAQLRYQVRVHREAASVGDLCHRLDRALSEARSRRLAADTAARLTQARAAVVGRIGRTRTMLRAVRNAEANAVSAIGTDACFPRDRALARSFGDRLVDDIAYLRTADDNADRMLSVLRDVPDVDPGPERFRPVFAVVTTEAETFAIAHALVDDPRTHVVPGDSAIYHVGTLPAVGKSEHAHRIVLLLPGSDSPGAVADACTNVARSFPTVDCVVVAGAAIGVPARGVRLGDVVVATEGVVDGSERGASSPSPRLRQAAKLMLARELAGGSEWQRWARRGADVLPASGRAT
ncbi:MAG: hypothetical protein HOV94_09350, partial [Saccharothrix sp.]|nr:hypothetical protein [Saccharothrix sp.]